MVAVAIAAVAIPIVGLLYGSAGAPDEADPVMLNDVAPPQDAEQVVQPVTDTALANATEPPQAADAVIHLAEDPAMLDAAVSQVVVAAGYMTDAILTTQQSQKDVPTHEIVCEDPGVPVQSSGKRSACVRPDMIPILKIAGWESISTMQQNSGSISPPMECDKTWVMSPTRDLGCVNWYTGLQLTAQKWAVLENYPITDQRTLDGIKDAQPREPRARPDTGHSVRLSVTKLPTVGENATLNITVESSDSSTETDVYFQLGVTDSLVILYPEIDYNEFMSQNLPGRFYDIPIHLIPDQVQQFNVTIVPTAEADVSITISGFSDGGYFATNSDGIYLSIGSQRSDYQLDADSHTREPDTNYIWVERPIPQCWRYPWTSSGQTMEQYLDDFGIVALDLKYMPFPLGTCAACSCDGGSILFLIHESDYDQVPSMGK